ncbi:MAG TPA: SRPBCC family protein [Acidimicrobiales bacterium]|nr:SRPBCC family protein [Acidimicrobiales bacterium]
MAKYTTTVSSPKPADEVFDYLSDLRNFAEWDPGVVASEQVTGDGGGSDASFDVTVKSFPSPMTLRYETVEYERPNTVRAVAESDRLVSDDRITVAAHGDSCTVTYDAELRLKGALRFADPFLKLAFNRIGDRAAAGLRTAVDGRPART